MFTDVNNQTRTVQDTINDFINTKKGKKNEETVKYYEQRLCAFRMYLETQEGIAELVYHVLGILSLSNTP